MIREYVEKFLDSFYSKHNGDLRYDIQEYLAFESLLVNYSEWLSREILSEKKECIVCGAVESAKEEVNVKPNVVKEVIKEVVKEVVKEPVKIAEEPKETIKETTSKPVAKVTKKVEVSVDDLMHSSSGEIDLLK